MTDMTVTDNVSIDSRLHDVNPFLATLGYGCACVHARTVRSMYSVEP